MQKSIRRRRHHANRAFATVLILMLLFMMLILVITYLRTMRAYSLAHGQADGDASQVMAQLETDIAVVIGADGKIAPVTTETAPLTASDIHEPYDYPWTNTARFCNSCRLAYPRVQTSSVGMGDPLTDDAWLSPWAPDASGNWTQVSNLFGSFLVYSNVNLAGTPSNPATHEFVPVDAPAGQPIPGLAGGQRVNFQSPDPTDPAKNLSSSDSRLVDTDGDGVGDALWFYPKSNLVNGLRYVAAVRIVDLSGCLNLNTALGELGDPPGTPSGTPRKGEGPYEINAKTLSSTLSLLATPGSNSKTYRSATATTDWDYWQKAGGQIGADGQTSASATGGRYGGNGTAASPKLSDEAQLRDLSNKLANASLSPAPKLFDAPSNGNTGHYGAMPSNTLRSQLTTISGRMEQVAFPTFLSWHFAPQWQGDLNLYQLDATSGVKDPIGFTNPNPDNRPWFFWSGPTPFIQTFFGGPDNNTSNDDYPFPPGFTTLVPTSTDRPLQYQIQVGACLQDAMQRDNRPTLAWNWMGWKPLPVLTEFYAQMPYVCGGWGWNIPATQATAGGAAVLLQKNTSLASLTPMIGAVIAQGAWIYQAEPYFWDTATNTFQLQEFDGGNTHVVKCKLTQVGSDLWIQNLYSKYKGGDQRGQNFDTLAGTTAYTAQPLFAGPVQAADGTWSAIYFNTQQTRNPTVNSGRVNPGYNDPRYGQSAGMGSYAFELANPYAIPIRLANLRFTFRGQDYRDYSTWNPAGYRMGNSDALDTFITAATGMPKDAEGFYVLKPGCRILFYRNGTENTNRPKASTDDDANRGALRPNAAAWGHPFGGPVVDASGNVDLMQTLFAGSGGVPPANTYAVDLGTANTAPDINNQPAVWDVSQFELQVLAKDAYGTPQNWWVPYNRVPYQTLPSGWDAGNCYICESNIPAGRQATPGSIVYKQVDVRTFGGDEKLDLLQSRPPLYWTSSNRMPKDWGDWEYRSNTYATASGVLGPSPGNGVNPWPAQAALPNGWAPGRPNTPSTMPALATWGQFNANLHSLGASTKIAFGTQTLYPSGNSDNTTNGVTYATYASSGGRQSIKNGDLFFNYVGIPTDAANYPGTFPELLSAPAGPWTSATPNMPRDNANANANNGVQRRDGTPHAMDIGKILMAGPIYYNSATGAGNSAYRGLTAGNWGIIPAQGSQLVGMAWQNTIGDAINFYLVKDREANGASAQGVKGLCLRADKPFYDATKVAEARVANKTLDQLYTDLATATAANNAADIAALRAGIRGQTFGTLSWADVMAGLYTVDSMKYKGRVANGNDSFRPGTININTASQAVLNCLSFPTSLSNVNAFTNGIMTARQAPKDAIGAAAPRQGLARVSELRNQGTATFGLAGATANNDLYDAVSWLPQQAACRSDVYCAYILVQGYKQEDFNLGPIDVRRAIVIYSRGLSGGPATKLAEYIIPNH